MAGRGTDIMLGGNAEFMAKSDLRRQGLSDELIAESKSFAETDDPRSSPPARPTTRPISATRPGSTARPISSAGRRLSISSAPSGTSPAASTTSSAAVPAVRGDPGQTQFYLSMQDDVMRLFGSERVLSMMDSLGLDEDTPIDAKILSGAIENAQKTVESRNYQARKSVLEYDDVMNVQRKIIYQQRQQVLDGEDLQKNVQSMMRFYVDTYVASAFGEQPHLPDRTAFFEMMMPL